MKIANEICGGVFCIMRVLLYSKFHDGNIADSLGFPEYSYYFVFKEFYRVLKGSFNVEIVTDFDDIDTSIGTDPDDCRLIFFSPPNKVPIRKPSCKSYILFAWEFDSVPDGSWSDNAVENWAHMLRQYDGAITLSDHTANVIRSNLGDNYPVSAIPVPVWDKFSSGKLDKNMGNNDIDKSITLAVTGSVVDSACYEITAEEYLVEKAIDNFSFPDWNGDRIDIPVSDNDEYSSFLIGFYAPEIWGVWSKLKTPSFLIPYKLQGAVSLVIDCAGYNSCSNQEIVISLGGERCTVQLSPEFKEITVDFLLKEPASLLAFNDLNCHVVPESTDPRSMGLGLRKISIKGRDIGEYKQSSVNSGMVNVDISGVVYTSVFNPVDKRKNWPDIVSAFCNEFKDNDNVVLVLKMTHVKVTSFLGKFHDLLQKLSPFKCRVIAIHGYLDNTSFTELIQVSNFYVNASSAEGLCLPLMEYMSSAVPAIAPSHTAMESYVDQKSCFILDSGLEPTHWPPDPMRRYTTLQYRVPWESIREQFRMSYDCLLNRPEEYVDKANAATEKLKEYSSDDVVLDKITSFLFADSLQT